MKAISLHQPWAHLIAGGLKQYETRDWTPGLYRGPIAIHAARGFTPDEHGYIERLKYQFPQVRELMAKPMAFGAIVCVCQLLHIYRTEDVRPYLSELELAVGNYAPGRAVWQLEVIEVFAEPIPCQGQKSLWNWEKPS